MLVLSRKVGDKLVIDGNITVEVVKIQGNRISLGIVAPSDVKILRGELTEQQAKAQKEGRQFPHFSQALIQDWLRKQELQQLFKPTRLLISPANL